MNQFDIEELRSQTMEDMKCRTCGGEMAIGEAGLVCQEGCGRIIAKPARLLASLRQAWPKRVILHGKE